MNQGRCCSDPEPPGLFEALAVLKDQLDINVELAYPDQSIQAIPGWRERSLFIARHGPVEFFPNFGGWSLP